MKPPLPLLAPFLNTLALPAPTFMAKTTRSRGDTLLSEDIFIVFSCRLLQFIVLPKGSEKEELLFPQFIDVETEA